MPPNNPKHSINESFTAKRQPGERSIREDVVATDHQILQLILKRFNLVNKIRKKGHLSAGDEKFIREAWQREATRISSDPEISNTLFSILQKSSFREKRSSPFAETQTPLPKRKDAYTLAPSKLPVKIKMNAPVSWRITQFWTYLGAASGCSIAIGNILQGNALASFLKILEQCGIPVKSAGDEISSVPSAPLGRPDIVLHIGSNPLSFYLIVAHYLGGASRVKIMGESIPCLNNLSAFMSFLPQLGCRLTPAIPKNPGLPVRIECSGLLPEQIIYPPNLPADFAIALCMAAIFYETPFAINLAQHSDRENIIEEIESLFKQIKAEFSLEDYVVRIEPGKPELPKNPVVPLEESVSAFLLAFASILKGKVILKGALPNWQKSKALGKLLADYGIIWQSREGNIIANNAVKLEKFVVPDNLEALLPGLPDFSLPYFCSLAACATLAGGKASLPLSLANNTVIADFLNASGILLHSDGSLAANKNPEILTWNAPDAYWGLALALASCAIPDIRPLKLGNPGIVAAFWKDFWQIYNGLPDPETRNIKPREAAPIQKRRRIITDVISTPPPERFEDE